MPWFRVDDNLSDHPKVLTAGNPAMGLWVRAGAWSMKHLTDGFIPAAVAALLGSPRERQALVASGLWLVADGGYMFHAWDGRQPTKDEVEDRRRARSEAGRKGGLKSAASKREANGQANASGVASASVETRSKQTSTPSRPVPSPTQIDDGDTSRPGTKVDARDGDTDEEFITQAAAELGVKDLDRLRVAFVKVLLEPFTDAELIDLTRGVLEASASHVRHVEAYVERACVNSPGQVRDLWARLPRPGVAA